MRQSGNDAGLVATPILTNFANGAALMGQFPKDFYYGTGGPMDTMLDKVFAAQHKAIAAVSKKLKSTRTVLEKSANVALTTVQRGTPAQPNAIWFNENTGGWTGSDGAMTLDTVWGVSDISVLGDGTLLVSGTFRSSTGNVDVSINGPELHTFTGTDSGTLYMNRWVAIFDNGGVGLAEETTEWPPRSLPGAPRSPWPSVSAENPSRLSQSGLRGRGRQRLAHHKCLAALVIRISLVPSMIFSSLASRAYFSTGYSIEIP